MAYQSIKDFRIKKYTNQIVIFLGLGIFLSLFFLFSVKILLARYNYQAKVIGLQQKALTTLNSDIAASNSLKSAYSNFVNQPVNIIGGISSAANSIKGGDNAKIILDALPSSYDFPELVTMLQSLLLSQGVAVNSISGTDQSGNVSSNGVTPIPFQVSVSGSYTQIQNLMSTFESSIRPVDILQIHLSGNQSNLTLVISAQTYYQPGIKFVISKEQVN